MAPRTAAAVVLAASLAVSSNGVEISTEVTKNPIRRVVTMLQNIQKKVEAEGEKDEKLHEKFMCYCKGGKSQLEQSIADAEAKLGSVGAAIKEAQGQKAQLEQDLEAHKADRAAAKTAVAEATSLREKEAAAYASFKSESDANIGAIGKAVAALEKGMAGSFLQTSAASALKNLVQNKDMLEADRQDIMAFLEGSSSSDSDYAPQSGQITGILKQLSDEMSADLKDATAKEEASITSFNELVAAKEKEIQAATTAIETKSTRLGEVSVSIAEMKGDVGDTADSLEDDKKFLADLEKNCAGAQDKYDAVVKERAEELVALADTIKMLNDDDALELFKKTLPSASASSLLQVQEGSQTVRSRALAALKAAKQPRLNFIAMALHGKKMGFDKVIAMIDEMVGVLKQEQADDDSKKEYCEKEFDLADDKKKELERGVSDAEKAIEDSEESIASLTSEIKALGDSIKALDKQVAEATEQRKAENSEFKDLMAGNSAAKELIGVAKNRLNKFYNPKLYKPPPKRELTEEERIAVNMGETLAPTPAPGGIAGTGVTVFAEVKAHGQADPGPAPEAVGDFKKKTEESNGVIALMDMLVADLDKEMTIAETEEKDAQGDYETFMSDSSKKRADDVKTLGDKESAKADTEAALQGHKDTKASTAKELMATEQYISSLHGECDWLLQYFDVRKEARAGEVDALGKAKAVLNGADYSLLQTGRSLRGRA